MRDFLSIKFVSLSNIRNSLFNICLILYIGFRIQYMRYLNQYMPFAIPFQRYNIAYMRFVHSHRYAIHQCVSLCRYHTRLTVNTVAAAFQPAAWLFTLYSCTYYLHISVSHAFVVHSRSYKQMVYEKSRMRKRQ